VASIAALGYVLVVASLLGVLALVDVLLESSLGGSVELTVLGASLGRWQLQDAVVTGAALAAVAVASLILGAAVVRIGRRRRRSKKTAEQRASIESLEAGKRLLEHKIELLLKQAKELEARQAEATADRAGSAARGSEDLVILPHLSSSTRGQTGPEHST
jgi:hypothetical protein